VEVFSQPDGAMTNPRRVFMTEVTDPQGQTLHFTYDTELRLVALTDAIGQVTTLSYELSTAPLKITKVTDPYGRSARFEYNTDGRLWRITDTVGVQSSFEYGAGDFIHALTTPYGTTTFSLPSVPNYKTDSAIQATDPLGGTERVMRLYGTAAVPAQDPANLVPTGFSNNANLHFFNTFYWSKLAWSRSAAVNLGVEAREVCAGRRRPQCRSDKSGSDPSCLHVRSPRTVSTRARSNPMRSRPRMSRTGTRDASTPAPAALDAAS
jgi:YD repeat-containing protein